MIRWIDTALSYLYVWPIGVLVSASGLSLIFGAIGLWSLWRVRRLLAVVPLVQDRLDTLSRSVSLLADTTESCFKALAMQLQFIQSQNGAVATASHRPTSDAAPQTDAQARKARQRRMVGAARRGDALAAIAASEDLAETEVALRLHVNREQQHATGSKRYGSMLS
jgi:hypothetical protein